MKFEKGDKVNIISKSYGRTFEDIYYYHGIISGTFNIDKEKVYLVNNDYFLECDLIKTEILFTDKDFEI